MAETKGPEEPTLPSKRKPDPSCEDDDGHPNKTQKLQNPNNSQLSEGETRNLDKEDADLDAHEDNNNDAATEYDDDIEDSDDDDEVDSNGEATKKVDRKGKAILIEEGDEDSDEDDSSDGRSQSDGDSDLSDDPLAEVDLDNILPSRTRRKVIQPGEYIANDLGDDDDDDSDSDDADA